MHRKQGKRLALLAAVMALPPIVANAEPPCLALSRNDTVQAAVMRTEPGDEALLARLVYAESLSTGFPGDPLVYQAIAWGVMNRVRLGEASPGMQRRYGAGVSGVIFRKSQFNPAVSARSPFSKAFLCPRDPISWRYAAGAARRALNGEDNPFIETPWERAHGLSLVVNFYYPQSVQARGRLAPWETSRELAFIGDAVIGGEVLSAERIRFYRLTRPPRDIGQ